MSTPAEKANRARIRDNQRRSRAHRKEYLEGLEERLRRYEEEGVQATREVQHAARKTANENLQLRGLLNLHGISDDCISNYLKSCKAAQSDPATTSHFTSSTTSESAQPFQQVIAPRGPATPDMGLPYVDPPQQNCRQIFTGRSSSGYHQWESGQSVQYGSSYAPSSEIYQPQITHPRALQACPLEYNSQNLPNRQAFQGGVNDFIPPKAPEDHPQHHRNGMGYH